MIDHVSYPSAVPAAAPTAPSVSALHELAEATHQLAAAAESFLAARDQLNAARERHGMLTDKVAKEREVAGI